VTVRPDPSRATTLTRQMALRALHTAVLDGRVVGVMDLTNPSARMEWVPAPIEVLWTPAEHEYRVLVPLAVSILQHVEDRQTEVGSVRALYRLDYGLVDPNVAPSLSEEDLMHYIGVHGVMHAWPYFRADVQAMVARLELPPLTLPVLLSSIVTQIATVRRLTDAELAGPQSSAAPSRPPSLAAPAAGSSPSDGEATSRRPGKKKSPGTKRQPSHRKKV